MGLRPHAHVCSFRLLFQLVISFIHLSRCLCNRRQALCNRNTVMFTLGTQGLVPGHRAQHINACTPGTGAYFSVRIQGLDLVLGHGHLARMLAWILDKGCVHI